MHHVNVGVAALYEDDPHLICVWDEAPSEVIIFSIRVKESTVHFNVLTVTASEGSIPAITGSTLDRSSEMEQNPQPSSWLPGGNPCRF